MRENNAGLVELALTGDKEAFADLVERYRRAIVATACSYLSDHNDVEDAIQDAVISAYTHLDNLKDADKLGPWILSITRRACIEIIRRKPVVMNTEQVQEGLASPDSSALLHKRLQVRDALSILSEDIRLTVVLAYVYGYSHSEIATLIDVPLNTIRSRLRNAKARLAGELAGIVESGRRMDSEVILDRSKVMKIIKYKSEDVFWSSIGCGSPEDSRNGTHIQRITFDNHMIISTCQLWYDEVMKWVGIDDPYTAGWFAQTAAISKVAAAGGSPVSSHVTLAVNLWDEEDSSVSRLCEGMRDAARPYQSEPPSFSLASGPRDILIAVNQLGAIESGQPTRLPGPRSGDVILVTNTLGDAITAIEMLKHKRYESEEEKLRLIKQHIEITPRVNEALAAWRSGLATSVQLTYRGLSTDLQYLSRASGVGARIHLQSLPMSDEMKRLVVDLDDLKDPFFTAGSGNEDYELLITCAKDDVDKLSEVIRETGSEATMVGEMIPEPGVFLEYPDGSVVPEPCGWRHW